MADSYELIATTAFGLEAVAARELVAMGLTPRTLSTGRLLFTGDGGTIARANIGLRSVDRVLLRAMHFAAPDFDALFETCRAFEWERFIPRDGAFPVNGRSVKSMLTSVPAVQRTVKKAIVERLMKAHRTMTLPETGARHIVEIALLEDSATITLDTSGDGLHKRGYRDLVGEAALKETLAAGLVLLSVWRPRRALVDPFCGTGTIAIEAAMIGRQMAPGVNRAFDAEAWGFIGKDVWSAAREEARARALPSLPVTIHASDVSEEALSLARRHAERAGVARDIHFQKRAFEALTSKAEYGCIVTNPPYGKRMGGDEQVEMLYRMFPEVLRRLPTWSHHILTARLDLEQLVGQRATRRRKLFNAQIECTYYTFLGPRPPRGEESERDEETKRRGDETGELDAGDAGIAPAADGEPGDGEPISSEGAVSSPDHAVTSSPHHAGVPLPPAFGGLRDRDVRELDDFEARLSKRARHLRRWPDKLGITCYRLYERDCPDVPVVVDRYEGHAHIFEHEREHSRTIAQQAEWLDGVAARVARVLEIPLDHVHVKSRPKQRGLTQHEKLDERGTTMTVHEGGLKFEVNLTDYADTGLFLDHRVTRGMVREMAKGARFLNLFCYTGAFTVYAAAGGAASSVSVDLSNTYLSWAERNMKLNGLMSPAHRFVKSDVLEFLGELKPGERFDLAVVDPPTFSNSKSTDADWEVQEGHTKVLTQVLARMAPGGTVFFSTNFRRFKLGEAELVGACPGLVIQEISHRTVPEDFRNERIHRCWRLRVV